MWAKFTYISMLMIIAMGTPTNLHPVKKCRTPAVIKQDTEKKQNNWVYYSQLKL